MVTGPEPLLRLSAWSLSRRRHDGDVPLLEDLDLEVAAGTWLAVLGANGSGKSSFLKYLGSDESPVAADTAIVFQDPDEQIIAQTVEQELRLGRAHPPVERLLQRFGLEGLNDVAPAVLSAGQKQRLALAVALQGDPALLLCDEPTALQDPRQAAWVLEELDAWRREPGRALITATCDRRELERADELLVLQEGRAVLRGPAAQWLEDPRVTDLVGPLRESVPACTVAGGPVLQLSAVACRWGEGTGFEDVNLTILAGERVGVVGPNGCGKSTLLAACAGVRPPDAGRVEVGDRVLYAAARRPDLDHGQALLAPQFPEYLFSRSTVADEIALDPALNSAVDGRPGELLTRWGLREELLSRNPHELSTGQKRRLALGMVAASDRPLRLLDEPTAALDRAGRVRVCRLLADSDPAAAWLIASHDREFLSALGCRTFELTSQGLIPAD